MKKLIETWKHWARQLKVEAYALYLAYRDPRLPWYARIFAACVVAYAFSPIDLIPEFIPVLGPLDDVVVAVLVLRYVRRRLSVERLRTFWRGTPEGFALLRSVMG